MKTIYNYITENKTGNPDNIQHGDTIYDYDSKFAHPIIYSTKLKQCIFGEEGDTHNNMLFNLDDNIFNKFSLYDNGTPIRFVSKLLNKYDNDFLCGRIWVIPNIVSKNRKYDVYIAWWNNIKNNKVNDRVISQYNKEFKLDIKSYIFIDNNGKFVLVTPEHKEINIDSQDKSRKDDLTILKQIHLATQKEKNVYFNLYKKNIYKLKDDELKRLGITDGTYAKRNNMFTKNTVKDPLTGKYKVVYGHKIGENINIKHNMKTLVNYILEKSIIGFGGMNPKYGQCVILAGGAASGKGFIQSRIDMQGKVFDVDELKMKYQKLAKAGIFNDNYEYDMTNPDDTGRLHQKVKEKGFKNKERNMFWGERNKKDEKHSSGLLPNVIFDMVSDDIKDIEEVASLAHKSGYNVVLVWVLCNKETAAVSNIIRGIDKKGKARSVPTTALEKGHKGAYETITALFNNKYPEVSKYINMGWIGFSCGYGRKLDKQHVSNPVEKIRKDANGDFIFNQGIVDEFLKKQQPIDYGFLEDSLNGINRDGTKMSTEQRGWAAKKVEKFKELADDFDDKQLNEENNVASRELLIEAMYSELLENNMI